MSREAGRQGEVKGGKYSKSLRVVLLFSDSPLSVSCLRRRMEYLCVLNACKHPPKTCYTHTYTQIQMYIHTHAYVHTHIHTHTLTHSFCLHTHSHSLTYLYTLTLAHSHLPSHTLIHTHTHTLIHTHSYLHICTLTFAHSYTHMLLLILVIISQRTFNEYVLFIINSAKNILLVAFIRHKSLTK